jgi:hypothetical protein
MRVHGVDREGLMPSRRASHEIDRRIFVGGRDRMKPLYRPAGFA